MSAWTGLGLFSQASHPRNIYYESPYLPLAAIAGLLCVVATGLINVREIGHLWRDEAIDRDAWSRSRRF